MSVQTADDRSQLENPMEIPKELWMMVDYLYRNAVQQEDLFQQPGLRPEFDHIRDCLDTGMIDQLCILQKCACVCGNVRVLKREKTIPKLRLCYCNFG